MIQWADLSPAEFVAIWQSCSRVSQVEEQIRGATAQQIRSYASGLRRKGVPLKHMDRGPAPHADYGELAQLAQGMLEE